MPITYDVGTHIIKVTGYTTGTPCTFTDVYNADKAGTLSLHARTGITGVDGANVAVDREEQPADNVVLGGASNDLYITITNWSGMTASILITGTGCDDAALTETIIVTANGQYNTTKCFKTITHTRVTLSTATNFDYDLTQGQWGVIWKIRETLFRVVQASFMLGDVSNDAYFKSVIETIEVYKMPDMAFFFNSPVGKGHLYLGEVSDVVAKTGKNGSLFRFESPDYIMDQGFGQNLAELYMYDTHISFDYTVATMFKLSGTSGRIWQSSITKSYLTGIAGNLDVYNLIVTDGFMSIYGFSTTGSMSKIQSIHNTYTVWMPPKTISSTIRNLYVRDFTGSLVFLATETTASHYLIDSDLDWSIATFSWHASPLCKIYRQYSFNLKVTDKDGNAIGDAHVQIWDVSKGSPVIEVDTYPIGHANEGEIPEQLLNYGFYNQAGGNTPTLKTPHIMRIYKYEYLDINAQFNITAKTNWTMTMTADPYVTKTITGAAIIGGTCG